MAITEGTQPAAVQFQAWTTAQTTASFTPESGALLVALVAADGSASQATTAAITDSLTGGTNWHLLARENTNTTGQVGGTAEVWVRDSPGQAMTVSVTGSGGASGNPGGQLVVRTLIGAAAYASQNGATNHAPFSSAAAVQVSVAAGTGNMIYGAAFNYDTSSAMTVLANTVNISNYADTTNGDNWAAFKSSGNTAGTATYGYSTSVKGMISAVEIIASGGGSTTVTAPAVAASGAAAGPVSGSATGWLYAGGASGVSGSWSNTANATGSGTGDYATWTDSGSGTSAALELSTFGVQAQVPAGATVDQVAVKVRHSEDPAVQVTSVTAQAYLATTPYGSPQALTVSATVHEDDIHIAGLTRDNLADLRIRVTATRVT